MCGDQTVAPHAGVSKLLGKQGDEAAFLKMTLRCLLGLTCVHPKSRGSAGRGVFPARVQCSIAPLGGALWLIFFSFFFFCPSSVIFLSASGYLRRSWRPPGL